jgi:hypothetical protein
MTSSQKGKKLDYTVTVTLCRADGNFHNLYDVRNISDNPVVDSGRQKAKHLFLKFVFPRT